VTIPRIPGPKVGAGLAAAVLALSACADDAEVEQNVLDPSGVTPADDRVFREPEAFDGVDVTLEGEVFERLGLSAFALQSPPEASGAPLLVVHDGAADPAESTRVAVTGVVRGSLDIAQVEGELGVDLDDGRLADNVGRPYLLASQVRTTP
jgi:hypothetical protein